MAEPKLDSENLKLERTRQLCEFLMKEQGKAQNELARSFRVSVATMSRWAKGKLPIATGQLPKVADYLQVTDKHLTEFLNGIITLEDLKLYFGERKAIFLDDIVAWLYNASTDELLKVANIATDVALKRHTPEQKNEDDDIHYSYYAD